MMIGRTCRLADFSLNLLQWTESFSFFDALSTHKNGYIDDEKAKC